MVKVGLIGAVADRCRKEVASSSGKWLRITSSSMEERGSSTREATCKYQQSHSGGRRLLFDGVLVGRSLWRPSRPPAGNSFRFELAIEYLPSTNGVQIRSVVSQHSLLAPSTNCDWDPSDDILRSSPQRTARLRTRLATIALSTSPICTHTTPIRAIFRASATAPIWALF